MRSGEQHFLQCRTLQTSRPTRQFRLLWMQTRRDCQIISLSFWLLVLYHELQVSAQRLLTFNRFKERLDISATKAARAFALDNLHERSRARVQRFGEYLKHRAPLVLIDENTQLTKRLLLDVVQFPDAFFQRLVVGVRSITCGGFSND